MWGEVCGGELCPSVEGLNMIEGCVRLNTSLHPGCLRWDSDLL